MTTYLQKLEKVTFSVHHTPNLPNRYQVRLVGKGAACIDNLQNKNTKDILGHGQTLEEAAKEAWIKNN